MTYGYWLDQANAALLEARHASVASRLRDHTDAAAAVAARTRVYLALARLTRFFDDVPVHAPSLIDADRMVATAGRRPAARPAVVLLTGLHLAAVADPNLPSAVASGHPVACHLCEAADELELSTGR